jgi:hypothetical protein
MGHKEAGAGDDVNTIMRVEEGEEENVVATGVVFVDREFLQTQVAEEVLTEVLAQRKQPEQLALPTDYIPPYATFRAALAASADGLGLQQVNRGYLTQFFVCNISGWLLRWIVSFVKWITAWGS